MGVKPLTKISISAGYAGYPVVHWLLAFFVFTLQLSTNSVQHHGYVHPIFPATNHCAPRLGRSIVTDGHYTMLALSPEPFTVEGDRHRLCTVREEQPNCSTHTLDMCLHTHTLKNATGPGNRGLHLTSKKKTIHVPREL
jgi:hypothetical protein